MILRDNCTCRDGKVGKGAARLEQIQTSSELHVFLPAPAAVIPFPMLQGMAESCSAPLTSSTCCQLWNLLLIYSTLEKHLTKERNDTAAEGTEFFFFHSTCTKLPRIIVPLVTDKKKPKQWKPDRFLIFADLQTNFFPSYKALPELKSSSWEGTRRWQPFCFI